MHWASGVRRTPGGGTGRGHREGLEGAVVEREPPGRVETADALGLVLDDMAVFAFAGLHEQREFLDAARELGQFVIARVVELHGQTLGLFLVLELVRQQLDAPKDGAVHDDEEKEEHDAHGDGEGDEEDAGGHGRGFAERMRPPQGGLQAPRPVGVWKQERSRWNTGRGALEHQPLELDLQSRGPLGRDGLDGELPADEGADLADVARTHSLLEILADLERGAAKFLPLGGVELPKEEDPEAGNDQSADQEEQQGEQKDRTGIDCFRPQAEHPPQQGEEAP